jgi:hypothetical protein
MIFFFYVGEVPEWLKGHDWKSCILLKRVSRVRIPSSPFYFQEALLNRSLMSDHSANVGGISTNILSTCVASIV